MPQMFFRNASDCTNRSFSSSVRKLEQKSSTRFEYAIQAPYNLLLASSAGEERANARVTSPRIFCNIC